MNTQFRKCTRDQGGFTLVEILVALSILGVGLFVLLETHYASLDLIATAQEEATFDTLITLALGTAEFEVLSGNTSGSDDFGKQFDGYSYTFTATAQDEIETPGLYKVAVTITGPDETRDFNFMLYDGQLYDVN